MMTGWMEHMVVVFHSLRYLRPSMVYWRVHRTVKGAGIRLLERAGFARAVFGRPLPAVSVSPVPRLTGRYHCEDIDLTARRFSFLRDVETIPVDPAAMRAAVARKPLLWQFHFGYHDYLLAILESRDNATTATDVLEFLQDWSTAFPLHATGARTSAWHPYVLSIRIESWVRLDAMLTARGVTEVDPRLRLLRNGVERMTRVLLRNLEKGTMANHLLRNVKALVFAGLYLDRRTGARARHIGLRLLDRELAEQVLDDGAHFERSPMYHVSVMNDVLDMAEAMLLCGTSIPARLATAAARMTTFLDRMRHPDGEIPFFNDSTGSFFLRTQEVLERGVNLGAEISPNAVRTYPPAADASSRGPSSRSARPGDHPPGDGARPTGAVDPARSSGLLVAETRRAWLVMDAGLVGPDYQPGHAHCDTLAFEMSIDGTRVLTDTGVYHYRESHERAYSRSTAAHNTIEIDGVEQSEVWKSFRVGRRARTDDIGQETRAGVHILRGTHDGYTRLRAGLLHERAMLLAPDWLLILDWLHGRGTHRWRGFLHLHPEVSPRAEADPCAFTARRGETELRIRYRGEGAARRFASEYYPAFGEKQPRESLVFEGESDLPQLLVTELVFGADVPQYRIEGMQVDVSGVGTIASRRTKR